MPNALADVLPMPARAAVRVLDLLRAIDGAALAGDLHAVRALVAAAVQQLEAKSNEATDKAGES